MVVNSLNNSSVISYPEPRLHEQLRDCLTKADALINVALDEGFVDHPRSIVHGYLWILSDLIKQARQLNDHY